MSTIAVTDTTWETEVIEATEPVLVDVWAEWCGPCKQIGPALEELSKEFEGKVKIVKLNADENNITVAQLGVRGIPALFMYKEGKQIDTVVGAAPKAALQQFIEKHI